MSNRKLWSYENGAISDSDGTVVLHVDDINEEVIIEVCKQWNSNGDLKVLQGYLDRSNLCTSEEGDYIMEQIGIYQEAIDCSVEGQKGVVNDYTKPTISDAVKLQQVEQPVVKKTRKPREISAVVKSNGKVLSSEEVIKNLKAQQEKTNKLIAAIEWVDSSTSVDKEFPDGLHTEAIQLLVKYGKDILKLKSEYIAKIQEL